MDRARHITGLQNTTAHRNPCYSVFTEHVNVLEVDASDGQVRDPRRGNRARGRGPSPGARGSTRRSWKPRAWLAPVREREQCKAQCTDPSPQRLQLPPETRAGPVPRRLLVQPTNATSSNQRQQPQGTFGAMALQARF